MKCAVTRPFAAALGLLALLPLAAAAQTGGYTFQTAAMPASGYPWQLRDNMQFVGGNYLYTPGSGYSTYNYPGAGRTVLVGLNNNGYILGQAYPSSDPNSTSYSPFLLANGTASSASAALRGLNTSFKTVTWTFNQQTGNATGYIYTANSNAVTTFGIYGTGTASAINDNGQVVGQYIDPNTGANTNYIRNTDGSVLSFSNVYGSAGYVNASGIANGPVVTGTFSNESTGTNFLFVRSANGTITTFQAPGGSVTYQPWINNNGVVLAGTTTGSTKTLVFAYPPGYTGPKAY